jgi:hypothetical protein
MKHVKGYVEFISESTLVNEGLMGDVHQLVKDTKSIEDFVKAFFKEYGDKIKQDKKSEEWVRGLYKDSSINETKVSLRVGEPLIYDGSKGIFKGWGSPGKTVHIEVDDELIEVPAKEIRKDPNYKYSTASSHGIAIAENVLFEAMDVSDDLKKVSTIDEFVSATKGKTVIKPGRGYVYPSSDRAFRLYSVSPKSQAMIGTAFTDTEALVNKAKKIIDTFYKTQNVKVK